ncbi:MAG: hypothetical protein AAF687_07470 [Pseudomonadota bacterium]
MRIAVVSVMLAACLMFAGYSFFKKGELYEMPVAQARAELQNMPMPFVLGGTRVSDIQATALQDGNFKFVFVDYTGRNLGEVRASIEQEGDGQTRIATYLDEGRNPGGQVARLQMALVTEQIDATLEKRGFHFAALHSEFAVAALLNAPRALEGAQRQMEAYEKEDLANIERAYEEEAAGRW